MDDMRLSVLEARMHALEVRLREVELNMRAVLTSSAHKDPESVLIGGMNLGPRALRTLEEWFDVQTAADVAKLTWDEVLRAPNCGVQTVAEIDRALKHFGVSLKRDA